VRAWATPLTLGAFFLMAATGVLMFFQWHGGLTAVVHQWFSWIFVGGVAGHVTANLRPFARHLASRAGRISLAAFATVLAASFFSWGQVTGPNLERPIEEALVDAPLSALAAVTRMDGDELVHRLEAHGIAATDRQTVRELSRNNHVGENRVLAIVFARDTAD
jgi:hypothetical protein